MEQSILFDNDCLTTCTSRDNARVLRPVLGGTKGATPLRLLDHFKTTANCERSEAIPVGNEKTKNNVVGEKHQQRQIARVMTLSRFAAKSHRSISKTIRLAMKLTAILLLSASLLASARGTTQSVTLSLKNAPLEKLFKEIKKQTGYSFIYTETMLKEAKPVTIEARNTTMDEVLQRCFANQPFSYEIVERTIILKPKAGNLSPAGGGGSDQRELTGVDRGLIDITGRVTDADGNPLIGATIKVKGSNKGTTTGNDGVFVLKGVDDNATLEISFVGFETISVAVNNRSSIITSLKIKAQDLNEVVINKGYYTEKQKYSVGNATKVSGEDIQKQPVANPLLALEGRVPGLLVTQNNGLPGGGVSVRIEGQNSLLQGNDPLYVIDGVPYASQLLPTTIASGKGGSPSILNGSSPFSFINPTDIESIEVLKDADATAIYGSRAANGAILITTKQGKAGSIKVNLNLQQGWGKIGHKMHLLNSQQYLEMRKEAFINDGLPTPTYNPNATSDYDLALWDNTRYTDWQQLLIGGTAKYTNANASISGGNSMVQYLFASTYHRETTVFPGSFSDQKAAVHFNIHSISINQKLSFQLSGNYISDKNQLPQNDLTSMATTLAPVAPSLYNADGTLNWMQDVTRSSTWTNPLSLLLVTYENNTNNLIADARLNYSILPGLAFNCSFGYNNMHSDEIIASPEIARNPEYRANNLRLANYANNNGKLWIVEPQVTYSKLLGQGKFEALIGGTIQQNHTYGQVLGGSGYNTDAVIKDMRSAAAITVTSSLDVVYKYSALFGRLNYKLLDKYIIDLTARRDGSSRFGSANQFHNFSSIGAAWIFSQESSIQNNLKFLSFGKLKASYGTTGNDQIGDYTFLNLYNPINLGVGYQGTSGLVLNGLPNPYIQWEETKKLQFGVDLGFLRDRILVNATWIRNRSSNQILSYGLPSITGNNSITENFPASIENKSWEFSVNSNNVKLKGFNWTSYLNLTLPDNKLLSFENLAASTYATRLIIGQPVNVQKLFHFAGVDPNTGKYQFTDKDGKVISSLPNNSTDRVVLRNPLPKFYGGFQNSFSYRRFQLDFLLQYVKQVGIDYSFFPVSVPGRFFGGNGNQPVSVLTRWRKTGDVTNIQQFSQDFRYFANAAYVSLSDRFYSDASFARLKNLSLSYLLPEIWLRKIHFQTCRVYITGQNLFTITGYNGLDPENPDINNTKFLPPLRVITIGTQLEF